MGGGDGGRATERVRRRGDSLLATGDSSSGHQYRTAFCALFLAHREITFFTKCLESRISTLSPVCGVSSLTMFAHNKRL